jgi:hypothetical protein
MFYLDLCTKLLSILGKSLRATVTPGFRGTKTRARTSSPGVLGPSLTHMMNMAQDRMSQLYYIIGVLYKINNK